MSIKSKERELFYVGCLLCAEIGKLEHEMISNKNTIVYSNRFQNIVDFKKKWVDLAFQLRALEVSI